MEICGSAQANLRAAIRCARRLHGQPVHADTLNHWIELIAAARAQSQATAPGKNDDLVADLERQLKLRGAKRSAG